jgi:opacity protein-like surface antigen
MKKNLIPILAFAGLIVSSAVFAGGIEPAPIAETPINPFGGFYVGLGIGVSHLNADWTYLDSIPVPATELFHGKAGFSSFAGQAYVGIGTSFNRGYLGLDGSYLYVPNTSTLIHNPVPGAVHLHDFSSKNTFTLAARAGFLGIANTMFYALIGGTTTQFKYEVVDDGGDAHFASNWAGGVTPGIGVEVALTNQLHADARYVYTFYKTLNHNLPQTDDGTTDLSKLKPGMGTFTVNLNYNIVI